MKRHLSNLPIYLACVVLALPWLVGAIVDWNTATFEATPANTDQISLGDDKIRELKENISARSAVETLWGNRFTGGDTGRAREGSARAFYAAACPSVLSDSATDRTGDPNLGTADDGRLCKDTATGELKIWTGTAWAQSLTALTTATTLTSPTLTGATLSGTSTIANIATGTNLIGTTNLITTPRFGSTAGADAFNPLSLHIRAISIDSTIKADAGCTAGSQPSSTALASQTFGDAGAGEACYSVTLDLSTRTYATSRVLVLGQVSLGADGGSRCGDGSTNTFAIFQDAIGTQIGPAPVFADSGVNDGRSPAPMSIAYITNLSNASHEFAIHVQAGDSSCDQLPDTTSGNFLMVVDLGPAY